MNLHAEDGVAVESAVDEQKIDKPTTLRELSKDIEAEADLALRDDILVVVLCLDEQYVEVSDGNINTRHVVRTSDGRLWRHSAEEWPERKLKSCGASLVKIVVLPTMPFEHP